MRRVIAALVASATLSGVLVGGATATALPSKSGPLPDATRTPGATDERVTQDNAAQTICTSGYTKTVRKVTSKTKSKVFAAYHVSKTDRSKYVIDHLIALQLGGSNEIKNLWPEPKKGDRNSISKDTVEDQLHTLVCNGTVPLSDAQAAIAGNWTTAATTVTTTTTTTTTTAPPPAPAPPTPAPTAAPAPPPGPACPNGTYVNVNRQTVCRPFSSPGGPPPGATAQCNDGTYSMSQNRQGTCSGHGGVKQWL
jgi:Protein of unknown function (DUF3761)